MPHTPAGEGNSVHGTGIVHPGLVGRHPASWGGFAQYSAPEGMAYLQARHTGEQPAKREPDDDAGSSIFVSDCWHNAYVASLPMAFPLGAKRCAG